MNLKLVKKIIPAMVILAVASCRPDYNHSRVKVAKVVDGDTVKLSDGRSLRYIGIDTPEIRIKKGSAFVYQPQPFSLEAKELNRKLVENKYVRIEYDEEKTDKYGRLLGYCFVDDIFVNAQMVINGLAAVYTYPPNVKYTALFNGLQQKARENRLGMWRDSKVIRPGEALGYLNQIATVCGKVYSSRKFKRITLLYMGEDYGKDFAVVIYNDSLSRFTYKNIDPKTFYKGKNIQVTGRIRNYRGKPQVIAGSPEDITVIN